MTQQVRETDITEHSNFACGSAQRATASRTRFADDRADFRALRVSDGIVVPADRMTIDTSALDR